MAMSNTLLPLALCLASTQVMSQGTPSIFSSSFSIRPDDHFGSSRQHHPFAGSNCTCETFCNYSCAINETKPVATTYYRMTPYGVYDMHDKNTGDARGDTAFVLSRRAEYIECRRDPNSFYCNGDMTRFSGDDPNSTDLIIEFTIEVDGKWGPYLYCNAVNGTKPLGPWHCTTVLDHTSNPQCSGVNMSVYNGYCWSGNGAKESTQATLGDCCAFASKNHGQGYTYFEKNHSCISFAKPTTPTHCTGGASGDYSPPETVCNCSRVHYTAGRRNLTREGSHPPGGQWFSMPEMGQCHGANSKLGDNNCTWKVMERGRVINASCMYERIDENIVSHDPSCFSNCPQPHNKTSDCWLNCFEQTTRHLSHEDLVKPWSPAFAPEVQGGCPQVQIPPPPPPL